mmetsp:Transcript_129065/g.413560  ORF Transcript_129065/g.413560 Transcript_129065/m.413560 type:complete len:220 (+) Transcript_129065:191-850(+)
MYNVWACTEPVTSETRNSFASSLLPLRQRLLILLVVVPPSRCSRCPLPRDHAPSALGGPGRRLGGLAATGGAQLLLLFVVLLLDFGVEHIDRIQLFEDGLQISIPKLLDRRFLEGLIFIRLLLQLLLQILHSLPSQRPQGQAQQIIVACFLVVGAILTINTLCNLLLCRLLKNLVEGLETFLLQVIDKFFAFAIADDDLTFDDHQDEAHLGVDQLLFSL